MATGLNSMTKKTLDQMNLAELEDICVSLKIQMDSEDKESTLVSKIKATGKYKTTNEKPGASVQVKDGVKKHKILGKYIKVRVHPTQNAQQNTSVFASIGLYTVEFQPHEEVELPIGIVKFLKSSFVPEHYYDPKSISENGNIGAHLTRSVPKYIVEVVTDLE